MRGVNWQSPRRESLCPLIVASSYFQRLGTLIGARNLIHTRETLRSDQGYRSGLQLKYRQ